MRYVSTRGIRPATAGFEQVVLEGLARDGGLFVPEAWPQLDPQLWADWQAVPPSYEDVAVEVMGAFVGDMDRATLRSLVREGLDSFPHEVVPLVDIGEGVHLLELFHGPTLAFKDLALQFLGPLFDHFMDQRGGRATILGATSGDTGSAAIHGCRGRSSLDIFITHPLGRTSEVQRRQMTTVLDANVHNIAIEGSFDDCQAIVKTLFGDAGFREKAGLAAVNSINWARIMAQVVYYFVAGLRVGAPLAFAVPTGNFGDVFAGYVASKMGLPITQLIVATNENDILARFLETGTYQIEGVRPTLSPSMDIQVSSNFERLLFDLCGRDATKVCDWMDSLAKDGRFSVEPSVLGSMQELFDAYRVSDAQTVATIGQVWESIQHAVDPHTATAVAASRHVRRDANVPMVVLGTAHPAKFPEAFSRATGQAMSLPDALSDLLARPERCVVLPNDPQRVRDFIESSLYSA